MCWPVRCTDRRATASLRMCERVDLARRRRFSFLFICMFLESGSACSWGSFEESGHGWPVFAEGPALSLLGFLQRDLFAGIAHALALVRLRRAEAANLGCHLTHRLLVRALDQDLGLRRGFD